MSEVVHFRFGVTDLHHASREARSRAYSSSKRAQSSYFLGDFEEKIRAEFGEIVGESPALKTALELLSIVAPTDSSVLILGETGTGKELVARAIHNLSSQREQALVKLNCAAIPLGLLESELFGHEKGAFTGANVSPLARRLPSWLQKSARDLLQFFQPATRWQFIGMPLAS